MSVGTRLAVVALAASMFACTSTDDDAATIALPPPNGGLDYQLGGGYEPTSGTAVVARDRTDAPDPGLYNICYVNGFQTQPGEGAMWIAEHRDLLLHNSDGTPVIDPEWPDEYILDTSSAEQREQLLAIVGEWIDGCAESGFQAVEIDNLDTYSRFPASLSADDAVEFARALAERAHAVGLAIGQKNAADLVVRRGETDFDFAVVEQCNVYDECDQFTAGYGDQVYIIEYEREAFERGCAEYAELSIVFRDLGLSARGTSTYEYDQC
ncbi:MAG: endo alpha-1,4 polygalactosaminidase [Ilumatobacteraceae bacterium]